MNYLINGTSSIVGNNIAKYIIKKKNFIYCYYNKKKPFNLKSNYSELKKNNFQKIFKVKKEIDCIIFCAIDKTNNYNNRNIDFLKKVCEFAVSEKIYKIIYISTMAIYGTPNVKIIKENTKGYKVDIYGKTKLKQEKILEKFSKTKKCQITILRLPGVVGQKKTGIFLTRVMEKLKNNEILKYKNPNSKFNNLIFVEDLAKIVYKISKNKKNYRFNIFNLGSRKPMILSKVINMIAKNFSHNNKIFEENTNGKSFIIDIKKFEKTYFKLKTTSNSLAQFIKLNIN